MYCAYDNNIDDLSSFIFTADGTISDAGSMSQNHLLSYYESPGSFQKPKRTASRSAVSIPKIYGIEKLIKVLGRPNITDKSKGGIAIWSSNALDTRGFKCLRRVEIIDEGIPSLSPVKHISNIYIWVSMRLNDTMIDNIKSLTTDMFYDRGKELLIVRSDCLNTAISQAALIKLYSKKKLSFYNIINNNLHYRFYVKSAHKLNKNIRILC